MGTASHFYDITAYARRIIVLEKYPRSWNAFLYQMRYCQNSLVPTMKKSQIEKKTIITNGTVLQRLLTVTSFIIEG
jgi:hypothetical protein